MDSDIPLCPVLKASDVVTRRWTPLVIRELLCGSRRFNDIHRGVPKMSRSLLTRRLSELERAGVVERTLRGDDAFAEAPHENRNYWLVIERGAVDLCMRDPGYDWDLRIDTDVLTLTRIWIGDLSFTQALGDRMLRVRGRRDLRRAFPDWFGLSHFPDGGRSCRIPVVRNVAPR